MISTYDFGKMLYFYVLTLAYFGRSRIFHLVILENIDGYKDP